MSDHDGESIAPNGEEQDSYDEFEYRIRRIGLGICAIWRDLSPGERIGHILALLTLFGLIAYTFFTIKIYRSTSKSANAALGSADAAQRQLRDYEASQGAIVVFDNFEIIINNQLPRPLSLKYTIKNTGATAATHVCTEEGGASGNINPYMYGNDYMIPDKGCIGETLPAGASRPISGQSYMYFTSADRDTEHRYFMVRATISYYDLFGNFKWEPICRIYQPQADGVWQPCPESKYTIRPQ